MTSYAAVAPPYFSILRSSQNRQMKVRSRPSGGAPAGFGGERKELTWQCVKNCGACCKLDKGPKYPTPDEIFQDPSDIQLVTSLTGPDGWCIHYDKSSRRCSIYSERPYFCRVEPEIFHNLYGVDKKWFDKEACRDEIKSVYGPKSKELEKFNNATRKGSQK